MLRAAIAIGLIAATPLLAEEKKSDATEFIAWLLQDDRDLRGIDFSEVLAATTGKKIIPVDSAIDKSWLEKLAVILNQTLAKLNDPSHPIHSAGRINEASRFIEDELLAACSSINRGKVVCTTRLLKGGVARTRTGAPTGLRRSAILAAVFDAMLSLKRQSAG